MAIEALVRKIVDGERPADGARSAIRALELDDYERLFRDRSIYTGFREGAQPDAPPYRQVLGPALDDLPAPVRAIHDATRRRSWSGRARVRRGSGLVAGIISRLIGFPPATEDIEVSVEMSPERGGERWTRCFGGKPFSSFQWPGRGRNDCLMMERFGIVTVALALVVADNRLHLVPRHWSCLGVPLPAFLMPRGNSFETVRGNRFCFDVEIAAPLIGLIVAYDGVLEPD
jgi:hypothetical protein